MGARRLNLSYDEESDTMYITFEENRQAMGIELNEDFFLRIDPETRVPIGLTIFNYKRQVENPVPLPLTGLDDLPPDLSECILDILKASPVHRFIALVDEKIPRVRSRVQEIRLTDAVGV